MSDPVVAVIIPAYRAHDTILRAIASLQAQSFQAWQAVIVADDGCDYRAAVGVADPRIAFTSTGRVAAGPSVARNVGLGATRAPLIAPLDADDRFRPERLGCLVPMALAAGAAADNVEVVRDGDTVVLGTCFSTDAGRGDSSFLSVTDFLAISVPMFFMCRREVAQGWDENLSFAEDVVFNVRVLDRLGSIPLCREPLYEYRVRAGSLSARADSAEAAERAYATMLDRVDADGFGLDDAYVRSAFRAAILRKRAGNRAFVVSEAPSFQEFVFGATGGGSPAPMRHDGL